MKQQKLTFRPFTLAHRISLAAGEGVLVLGLLVLAGWMFDIAILKKAFLRWDCMMPNTALCFVLTGGALCLLQGGLMSRWKKGIAWLCAGAAVLIGMLTLGEYVAGISLGIDELMFEVLPTSDKGLPGRMGVTTALNFIMLGAALLLLGHGRTWLVRALTIAAGLSAYLALLDWVFGAGDFYGIGQITSMTLHTSPAFLLLCVGVAAASNDAGILVLIGSKRANVFVRRLFPAALGAPLILGWLRLLGERRGLYGMEFGVELMVVANTMIFVALIWWSAQTFHKLDALRESAEAEFEHERFLLRALMEHVPDRIYFKDAQCRFLRNNRAHLELFGMTEPGQVIGKSDFDFFSEEHARHAFEDEQRVMKTGVPVTLEEKETWPDGRVTWVLSSKLPLRDVKGRVIGTFGISHDITARKQREEELRASQARLNRALDAAQIGEWELDLQTQQVRRSLRHDQIFGYEELLAEWSYQDFLDHVHPEDCVRVDQVFKEGVATGKDWEFECRILRKDRSERQIWARGGIYPDSDGGATRMLGMLRDITGRKHAEEAMKLMSNRLVLATRAAAIGIWDFDPVNNQLVWDEQMFRVFGIKPDQFSGTYEAWQATVHPDDLLREMEKVQMALQGEQAFDSEFRVIWPDRSIHYIKADAMVQRDDSGKAVHMIGTNWDITEQKNAEQKLARTVAELARSNADLAQFASVASHDLQEPLRAVAGCVELIAKGYRNKLDDGADELIQHALEGTKRMQTLIRDLLEYSRINTRGKPPETTDANTALDFALANLMATLRERDVLITRDPLPTVLADRTQLAQIFQNLIANGVKFCVARRPEIHIGAEFKNDCWIFSVRDNGIGIEPQYRERIFVLFQRLHTRTEYPGTGIGLAICKRIVERHNGRIWVESEPGKGSTFFFTLNEQPKQTS